MTIADLLTNEITQTSYFVPKCFVRIDVAHFIKICSRWTPIKSVPRRVKEIVLRSIGLLIKSQSIVEIRSLLLSMFAVFSNETAGICLRTRQETPCETHKKKILEATSCGFIEFEQQFNDAIALAESEDEARTLLDELYENQNEGLGNFENPFKAWADSIYNDSESLVKEGSTTNPLYIPDLVPILIKIMKFLPLWSGVMVPIFGYGDEISSSAAVESSFRKLKTVTFKHISLPTELEYFLETHITSLKGAALIRTPSNINVLSSPTVELNQCNYGNEHSSSSFDCTGQNQWPDKTLNIIENNNNNDEWSSLRFIEDNQKSPSALYVVRDTEVFINEESDYIQENEDCENPCINDQESKARESWNRKSNKERKSNSYLVPNPQLRYLHISNLRNKQSLPILKNGSRFEELKSTKNKNRKEKIILSNTCAFDSLTSLMMVSYCDSQLYANKINDIRQNSFF
ncbi:unnamed protein product [Macrosiphum euphorbiae]|uniref:Transposase n=1 Tax=Macrosiphum euphorbiae TaxID=13131 RepID=A0AAV0WMG8_9HEMI|nr:unnamed protein product [Macrosiphum euphorbiae]